METGGGLPEGAAGAAARLVGQGVDGLISFGLAGGLDPRLRPGTVVIPETVSASGRLFQADPALARLFGGLTGHVLWAGTAIVAAGDAKLALHRSTGAHVTDLESGSVAEVASAHGLPFLVVRAVCDPAGRSLPPAAMVAMDQRGRVGLIRIVRSLLKQPSQFPDMFALALDAMSARRGLVRVVTVFAKVAVPGENG